MARRNLRRIPAPLIEKIRGFPSDEVVVAVSLRVTSAAVEDGRWDHLGWRVDDGLVVVPDTLVPPASSGRYSRANAGEGWERVRRDWPKVKKTFSVMTPNWGDWSKGSHVASWTRDVYQREFFPPNETPLLVEVLQQNGEAANVRVSVGRTLDRNGPRFETDLFYDLNLLQENVGATDVYRADATRSDFLGSTQVQWEILPPGERETVIRTVVERLKPSEGERRVLEERLDVLMSLRPTNFVTGTSGFQRYFGAQFGPDLVVFENLRHGNAIYAMYENWATLSQRSRTELLSGSFAGFDRVIHKPGWERRIAGIVTARNSGS